jgi:hypothetical protein
LKHAEKRSIGPVIISEYFEILREVTKSISPRHLWNPDETSFCLDPSRIRVVGDRGTASHRATSGPGKENITVLMATNAAGQKLPPFIVFKCKNVWDFWMAPAGEEYPEMTYAATKIGWMEAETFSNYFTSDFIQNIHPERSAVLICDGQTLLTLVWDLLKRQEKKML